MATTTSGRAVLDRVAPSSALPARRRRLGALAANPALATALALGTLVAVSTALRFALGLLVTGPTIHPDEWIYAEYGKSLAALEQLSIRDVPVSHVSYGIVYPLLLAPLFALFADLAHAYTAIQGLNALVMSSAAIPAFLLGRRLLSRRAALAAAALTVFVPSMAYTASVLTENVFYPLFLWAALALTRALERPTLARQAVLVGALGLLVLTRAQAVALVPAALTAIALVCLLQPRAEGVRGYLTALRPYRATFLVLGALPVLAALAQTVRGGSLAATTGAYEGVFSTIAFADVPRYVLYHVAVLDLYVGFLPFLALLLLCRRASRRDAPQPVVVLAAVTVSTAGWLVVSTAVFATAVQPTHVYDRYIFYVAPLLLVAALYELPRASRSAATWAALAVTALLPAAIPIAEVAPRWRPGSSSAALLPWVFVPELVADLALPLVGLALGAAALTVAAQRRTRVVVELVLVSFLVVGLVSTARFAARSHLFTDAASSTTRSWIDRTVGADARVDVLWSGLELRGETGWYTVWENEFFNRSVRKVYALEEPTGRKYDLPEERVTVGAGGVLRHTAGGAPVTASYVLVDHFTPVAGELVARDAETGMALYRPEGEIRLVGARADRRWNTARGGR